MKKKTQKTIAAVGGSAVVIGSLVLLHKSGKVEHLGTVMSNGGKVVVDKARAGGNAVSSGVRKAKRAVKGGRKAREGGLEMSEF